MDNLTGLVSRAISAKGLLERPFVTLAYAQSLDGSISGRQGSQVQISGECSMQGTHSLRALHDGILVGIETVCVDDPRLTVRLVDGDNPIPIVLDSSLRIPDTCSLMSSRPWIFCGPNAELEREKKLSDLGARVTRVETTKSGYLNLEQVLSALWGGGVGSLMVEGGGTVLSCFLSDQLVDLMVVSIAPALLMGVPGVSIKGPEANLPWTSLTDTAFLPSGSDMCVVGKPLFA